MGSDAGRLLWLVLGVAIGACAESVPAMGGETNWLMMCSGDADCTEGACQCGVCTTACEATSDCQDAQRGVCRRTDTVAACSLVGASEVGRMCLPRCLDAGDCGEGFSCDDGACVPLGDADGATSGPATRVAASPGDDGESTGGPTAAPVVTGVVQINGEVNGTLGTANAIVGDLDADGYDDLVALDYGGSGRMADTYGVRGAAYLFYGRPAFEPVLEAAAADAIFRGGSESVTGVGDVDADGLPDFAFSSGAGVHVVFGSRERLEGERLSREVGVLLTLEGAVAGSENSHFFMVDRIGDVDGDGHADLFAHGNHDGPGGLVDFRSFLVSGATIGSSGRVDLATSEAVVRIDFGQNPLATGAGDVDGDGYGDVLVLDQQTNEATLLYGSAGLFDRSAVDESGAPTWDGVNVWTTLGSAGDLDGDGYGDFAVGDEHRLAIVYGRPQRFTGTRPLVEGGPVIEAQARPAYLAGLAFGDVDGNGWPDIVLGDPHREDDGLQSGAVYTLGMRGRLEGSVQLDAQHVVFAGRREPDGQGEDLGYGAASGGDVNGDGFDDVIVGAPGHVIGDEYGGVSYLLLGGP